MRSLVRRVNVFRREEEVREKLFAKTRKEGSETPEEDDNFLTRMYRRDGHKEQTHAARTADKYD